MNARTMCVLMILMAAPLCVWAQSPACEDLKQEYQPQSTPEATYELELKMMKQGVYCYDLPIFDMGWQKMASRNSHNEKFKRTAGYFDVPSKTYQEGKYAVIYYPGRPTLGPVFLYREDGKWIIDRSRVYEFIRYDETWHAYDGDYPYLEMLRTIFPLKEGRTANGQKVFKVQ